MSSYKPYPEYKSSGYDWLEKIPEQWPIRRLKFGFELQKRAIQADMEIVTAFRDGQVTLRKNRRTEGFTEGDKQIGYQGIEPGDLVIHAMDSFAGAIGVSDSYGKSTPVYSVCRARAEVEPRYFALTLRHLALTGFIESLAKGVRERSTDFRWADAKNLYLPIPSTTEQRQILAFLDHETAEIDAFIVDQEELIRLLNERRAATITQAVTKGLDPNAPMKDSGIEWFPQLPLHWPIQKVSRIAALIQTGPFGSQVHASDYVDEGVPLINPQHIVDSRLVPNSESSLTDEKADELSRHRLLSGDVVVARRGELGRSAVVSKAEAGSLCGTGSLLIRLDPQREDPRYFQIIFSSTQNRFALVQQSVGATMDNLNAGTVARLMLPTPPLDEQKEIADYLDRETAEIDATIADAKEAIALSKERRAALISAAVTGKIDVRDHSAVKGAA